MRGLEHAAHSNVIAVGGTEFLVRRTFKLWSSIEAIWGPIGPLSSRIAQGNITAEEVCTLTKQMLSGCDNSPSDGAIEDEVMDGGMANLARELDNVLLCLGVGNRQAQEYLTKVAEEEAGGEHGGVHDPLDENPIQAG